MRSQSKQFLEGFPERYLTTRSPERSWRQHFEMTERFDRKSRSRSSSHHGRRGERNHAGHTATGQAYSPALRRALRSVGNERRHGRRDIADSARAWSSTASVSPTPFGTLELNASERTRGSSQSVSGRLVSGRAPLEEDAEPAAERARKRRNRWIVVETKIDFDDKASSHSTLLQVVAQDVSWPAARAISKTLSELGIQRRGGAGGYRRRNRDRRVLPDAHGLAPDQLNADQKTRVARWRWLEAIRENAALETVLQPQLLV